jgi:hypothetical protein
MRFTCDSSIWGYGITGTAHVALRCKFIRACGVRINPALSFTGFSAKRYMRYTSDTVAPHAAVTALKVQGGSKICSEALHSVMIVLRTVRWGISLCGFPVSRLYRHVASAIIVIAACGVCYHCYSGTLHYLINCTVHRYKQN